MEYLYSQTERALDTLVNIDGMQNDETEGVQEKDDGVWELDLELSKEDAEKLIQEADLLTFPDWKAGYQLQESGM